MPSCSDSGSMSLSGRPTGTRSFIRVTECATIDADQCVTLSLGLSRDSVDAAENRPLFHVVPALPLRTTKQKPLDAGSYPCFGIPRRVAARSVRVGRVTRSPSCAAFITDQQRSDGGEYAQEPPAGPNDRERNETSDEEHPEQGHRAKSLAPGSRFSPCRSGRLRASVRASARRSLCQTQQSRDRAIPSLGSRRLGLKPRFALDRRPNAGLRLIDEGPE
jgi:hypothetical protein